jgi:PAS domain-containing protein
MNAPTRHDPTGGWPEGELATATDFVRHFGHYAASSLSKPVYIAQHGRVGWALLSAAQMTRLSESESETTSLDARFDIMIDSISTIVILVDADFGITRMNCAGRRHFQVPDGGANPVNFRDLLHVNNRDFIGDFCTRVLNSGDSETFEIESARYPGQTLHFQILPFPSGLAILADVVTQATRIRQFTSAAAAAELAIDATDSLGRGRVDVRGTITTVNDNLVSLAKSTADKIMGLRLPALFEQGSRTVVRDALDGVLSSGKAFSLQALMLDGTGSPMPVTIGVGVERDGGLITGAAFMIMPNGAGSEVIASALR